MSKAGVEVTSIRHRSLSSTILPLLHLVDGVAVRFIRLSLFYFQIMYFYKKSGSCSLVHLHIFQTLFTDVGSLLRALMSFNRFGQTAKAMDQSMTTDEKLSLITRNLDARVFMCLVLLEVLSLMLQSRPQSTSVLSDASRPF